MFRSYLKKIGLEKLTTRINNELNKIVEKSFVIKKIKLSSKDMIKLYQYEVPQISPDGSCSLDKKSDKPYNLATTLGLNLATKSLERSEHTLRLWRLKQVVYRLQKLTKPDWLGIYRKVTNPKGKRVLVKESYYGAFSRPEFPLKKEFAKHSNNSTVGLTGKARIIYDVFKDKGPYYKCDGKVRSEFCSPILNKKGRVIGIIDAESFKPNFFTPVKILEISKVCADLGERDLGLSN